MKIWSSKKKKKLNGRVSTYNHLLPPRWTCQVQDSQKKLSVPMHIVWGYRWAQTLTLTETGKCTKEQKKSYRISDLQIIKWRFIACNMKRALYFPGFLSAQMRAPCPPMEWPEMDIFSGSAGKLELISRGSWEQEKEDEDECMRQCLRCQCFIFNCNHLQSITFPSE